MKPLGISKAHDHRVSPWNAGFRPARSRGITKRALRSGVVYLGISVSIRSPHRSKGRRWRSRYDQAPTPCFNPLPSPKQGETPPSLIYTARCLVSIRSPHRSKGRPAVPCPRVRPLGFQSAPLTEARGDPRTPQAPLSQWSFNPLPSPKQGETRDNQSTRDGHTVSIRSPHRSKGRHGYEVGPAVQLHGFNPLPSPKQGETWDEWTEERPPLVSIRSPHRSKGRPSVVVFARPAVIVSIRSPHRSKGRHQRRER